MKSMSVNFLYSFHLFWKTTTIFPQSPATQSREETCLVFPKTTRPFVCGVGLCMKSLHGGSRRRGSLIISSYRPRSHSYNNNKPSSSLLIFMKKNRCCRRLIVVFVLYVFLQTFIVLKTWFPGDPTLRRISESSLKLMFSRSGFSFGTSRFFSKRYSSSHGGEVKLRSPKETRQTKKQYVVQGHIPDRPTWEEDLNIQKYIKDVSLGEKRGEDEGGGEYKQLQCFFTVDANEPKVILYDDGRTHVVHLGKGNTGINMNELTCEHYRATTSVENHNRIEETWNVESEGENVGKLAIVSSATNVEMLSEYHRTLLNHVQYAKSHKYANYLSLVKQKTLEGRSGKFAKHLAMGALIATGDFDTVCHVDLDAWFSSWAPLSYYAKSWPRDKDLLFGDTDQIWINSGLMIARATTWSAQFFEKVMNAVHSVNAQNDEKVGFKRDQPAVWHVLAEEWREQGRMPYKGAECESWNQCNPDENPVECWHWCHWDALQRIKGWTGLTSLNTLPNIHLIPTDVHPQMHRMCIRSCYSVAARAVMGICSGITRGASMCLPKDVDKMSLCDGKGCLRQMDSGAWLKHTGHQHWRDVLPSCVPRNREEATLEQNNPFALCSKSL